MQNEQRRIVLFGIRCSVFSFQTAKRARILEKKQCVKRTTGFVAVMSATGLTYHRRVASAATAPVKYNSLNNFPKHRTQQRVHSVRAFLLLFSLFSISFRPTCDVYALSMVERMSNIGSHHDSHGERMKQVNRHGERV